MTELTPDLSIYNDVIEFTILGKPMGKQRARSTSFGKMYTPAPTVQYENLIKMTYGELKRDMIQEGSIHLSIEVLMPIPTSWSKKKQDNSIGRMCTTKPDVDNIAKIVMDALNGIAWRDDSQVTVLLVTKRYSEQPKLKVRIEYYG